VNARRREAERVRPGGVVKGAGRACARCVQRRARGRRWGGCGRYARGHDVGTVEEVGDAAEALGLALGAEVAAALVEPLQQRVVLRLDRRHHAQLPVARGRDGGGVEGEARGGEGVVLGRHVSAVHLQALELHVVAAVQHQRRAGGGGARRGVGPHPQGGLHRGEVLVEEEVEGDGVDGVGHGRVVGAALLHRRGRRGGGGGGGHGAGGEGAGGAGGAGEEEGERRGGRSGEGACGAVGAGWGVGAGGGGAMARRARGTAGQRREGGAVRRLTSGGADEGGELGGACRRGRCRRCC
jgi:hypothetical protein